MIPECDCKVVDDPDMVCPKHQEMLVGFAIDMEKENDRLRAQNEELVKAINEAISKADDAPFEWIRLNQDYLKPIVRPLKQALKSSESENKGDENEISID